MPLIAITGGLGFIGTNLVPVLIERLNADIRILDNMTNPSGELQSHPRVEILEGDIRDAQAVEELVSGADAVVHLAAHTRVIDSIEDPALNFDINVVGTFCILEAMRRQGVNRFVNASTGGAILGEAPPPIHEDMTAKPASPYGASKLATEGYGWAYAQSYGIHATSLRFSNIYGPNSRNKASVVAAFLKQVLHPDGITVYGTGEQTRDYLYVEDLAHGIASAIESQATGVFQLGSGKPTSINELISLVRTVVGQHFPVHYQPFRAGEILHTHCNINKARQEIGYAPSVELADGIARTWEWFRGQKTDL